MSELSKRVNEFFKSATRLEVKAVKDNIYISEHLNTVFEMFYIQKKDIEFIAFKTGYSRGKIEADLRLLRKKLSKLI